MSLRRATSLGPPEVYLLDQWARSLWLAFDEPPYLVGSVARGEDWRDVDIRMMLDPEQYEALTGGSPDRLQALNVAISIWGQRATGLPIDFQFQEISAANAEFDGPRNPRGIVVDQG